MANIEIFNDDFRNIMANKKYDIIVTDPPYNIDFNYNSYKDNLPEREYISMISEFHGEKIAIIHYPEESMKYFVPALGVPDEVVTWAYNSNLPGRHHRLINIYNVEVNFNAVKMPYKNPNDKRIKKLIENGSSGRRSYDWFNDIQLVKNVSKEKSHPCPVPIKLMERIILLTTKEGDTVFDPFMGSGTTGIACRNLNRNFIGTEIDEKYFAIARERLSGIE